MLDVTSIGGPCLPSTDRDSAERSLMQHIVREGKRVMKEEDVDEVEATPPAESSGRRRPPRDEESSPAIKRRPAPSSVPIIRVSMQCYETYIESQPDTS